MLTKNFVLTIFALVVLLGGCANDFSGNVYSSNNAGEVAKTDIGTVISARRIKIKQDGANIGTGAILGGVGGGVAGSMLAKKEKNKGLATVAGAMLGAVVGNSVQNRSINGIEYQVRLENKSSIVTIVQGIDPEIGVGQKVYVINSEKGRSKIVPA